MLKNPETQFSGFAVKTSSDHGFFFTHSIEVLYENFIRRTKRDALRVTRRPHSHYLHTQAQTHLRTV